MDSEELAVVLHTAEEHPEDVEAQIAAAWASDSHRTEEDAIRFYDKAWALGIPDEQRKRFIVGYGSTLRNVGRQREAVELLTAAVGEFPGYAPHSAFLAPALHTDGQHDAAMAASLTALLQAGAAELDGYDRALTHYRNALESSE